LPTGRRALATIAALTAAALAAACGQELAPVDLQVAREKAAALFADDEYVEARAALEPLVERSGADAEDFLRRAIAEYGAWRADTASGSLDVASEWLERAAAAGLDVAGIHYLRGILCRERGDFAGSVEHFQRAHELVPDDFPTHLRYANVLAELDRFAEAEPHYLALLEVGLDFGGSWYLTTVARYKNLLTYTDRFEEAQEWQAREDELRRRKITVPSDADLDFGRLAVLDPPPPRGNAPAPRAELGGFRRTAALSELAGATGLAALDLRTAWMYQERDGDYVSSSIGPGDLVAYGATGLWFAESSRSGAWRVTRALEAPVSAVAAVELEEDVRKPDFNDFATLRMDGDLDFWVATADGVALYLTAPDRLDQAPLELPELPDSRGAPHALVPVDFDHEGDVDLLLAGAFGCRLWRNDSGLQELAFADATAESGLPADRAIAWAISEDLDTDMDVDLLLGTPAGEILIADNLRGGRFELRAGALPAEARSLGAPLVADLDGDARPDLLLPGGEPEVLLGRADGTFRPHSGDLPARIGASALLADLDLNGALDCLWPSSAGLAEVLLDVGLASQVSTVIGADAAGSPTPGPIAAADFDGDGDIDLARLVPAGLEVWTAPGTEHGGLALALRGIKDSARALGAVVELRAGPIYRREYWRGEPLVLGLGDREQADVLRIVWPNGVHQSLLDVERGTERVVKQKEGLVGSCPFLYAWNGERYVFVTDVLGITPLGLPMAPGMLVPPDHDEYVLVRAEELQPKDGLLELQLTEELREVTYLDQARLYAVDHPADSEVFPNERFTFPPFPEHHIHAVRAPLAALRARGSDGGDWTSELAAIDHGYAAPFAPLAGESGGQFLGLAEPHWLELEFDPERVRGAQQARLVMTGWFLWTDASANVAAARTSDVRFVPPTLQVPDGTGGWRDAGPPIGFPAGKHKTMVVDVSALLDRADPRLRLASTLRLYWDSIRLAVDAEDAPTEVREAPLAAADLRERGFSEPVDLPGVGAQLAELDWFEWERLAAEPRWDQHPGMYTRFGDVRPLARAIDDRFVILGSGDALRLAFDAGGLAEPRAGWRRDYLLFLDGWAKDRDPNTLQAELVTPLPFHGMSGYPYGPDEAYPDDVEHRRYQREWNTRPAKTWLAPLAPGM
jgi:tetratricopeptide (TPR) repeat protein